YLPASPKYYKSKSKNAQEAHEAIRPTEVRTRYEELGTMGRLTKDHERLYDLIWKRFLACQMNEAVLDQTSVDVSAFARGPVIEQPRRASSVVSLPAASRRGAPFDATPRATSCYLFRATGSIVKFDGWMK